MQDDSQNAVKSDDSENLVNVGCDDDANNEIEKINKSKSESENEDDDHEDPDELIFLPRNPNEWDEKNISTWVNWISKKFKCDPKLETSRFPTDSQELLKFTKADFWVCSGSGVSGNIVAKHYGYLLQNATGIADSSLFSDLEPGKIFLISILLHTFSLSIGK